MWSRIILRVCYELEGQYSRQGGVNAILGVTYFLAFVRLKPHARMQNALKHVDAIEREAARLGISEPNSFGGRGGVPGFSPNPVCGQSHIYRTYAVAGLWANVACSKPCKSAPGSAKNCWIAGRMMASLVLNQLVPVVIR